MYHKEPGSSWYERFRLVRAFIKAFNAPSKLQQYVRVIFRNIGSLATFAAAFIRFVPLLEESKSKSVHVIDESALVLISELALALVVLLSASFLIDFIRYFIEARLVSTIDLVRSNYIAPSTRAFMNIHKMSNPALHTVVEIFAHPYLDKSIEDNGWRPDQVRIIDTKIDFSVPDELQSEEFISGDDNDKYSLSEFEFPFSDSGTNLVLSVKRTKWSTLQRALKKTINSDELRHIYLSPDPAKSKIPSSLCLHFVCLTSDDKILSLRRREQAAYYPGAYSISFEEQLSHEDMLVGESSRARAWFRRALCEEIFPLTGVYDTNPGAAWEAVEKYVRFMNIWSGFIEEDTGNYSLSGVCKLNLSVKQLVDVSGALSAEFNSRRDDEGRLYYFTILGLEEMMSNGHTTAQSLYNPQEPAVVVDSLHPSGYYRASMVLNCLRA